MTALNAVGLTPAMQPTPVNSPPSSAPKTDGGSSFFALLQQKSTEESSVDSGKPNSDQPPHKKDSDPVNTAVVNANLQLVTPADNLPLPTRLSLNLFGPKSQPPKTEGKEDRAEKTAEKKPNDTATPLVSQLPAMMAQTVISNASKAAANLDATDRPADQGKIPIDLEDKPASAPPAQTLAFALRLTPAEQHGAGAVAATGPAKGTDAQANAAPANAQAIEPQRANSGSSTDNRRSDDQPSESGAAAVALPVTAVTEAGSSYQAIHMAVADAPQPTASAPAQTHTDTLPIATHGPLALHSDTPAKTGTANELSLSVSSADQQKVEVRVMDRAGEVRVSVRTPNEELASTLRTDLGSLTGRLNQSGFTAETFAPATHTGEFSGNQSNTSSDQQQGRGSGGNAAGQNQQQDSQQDGRAKRPAWLDEFENSMAHGPVRKDEQ